MMKNYRKTTRFLSWLQWSPKALKKLGLWSIVFLLTFFQANGQNCSVSSGIISTSSATSFCVGDGIADEVFIDVNGNTGTSGWIITDDNGTILDLPSSPPFNFEGAGIGTCAIWHIAYEGEVVGLTPGNKIIFIEGCFDLSNAIPVTRLAPAEAAEIELATGGTETAICAGDGIPDPLEVVVEGGSGAASAWIITDDQGNILALPDGGPFDLEGAGAGTCLIWYLTYNGEISGLDVGENANDIQGCAALSNPITVVRNGVEAAEIELATAIPQSL